MNNQPIGVLDSGVGGLSIWKEIVKKLPKESTIYLADSKNCPYGSKSSDAIYKLSKKLVRYLIKKKVKLIIIACNTITVSCLDKLRQDFPQVPIIGTVPVIKTAVLKAKNNKVGVLSTVRTAKSKYQKKLIQTFAGDARVLNIGTDKLVQVVERGETNTVKINKILNKQLKPFLDFKIDVLALGCSHFPFLKKEMQKILGKKVLILDSSGAIARQVERVLLKNRQLLRYNKPSLELFTTGDPVKFKKLAETLVKTKLKNVEFVDL